jgi:hypothetical protein
VLPNPRRKIVAEAHAGNDGTEQIRPGNQTNQAINVAINGNKARVTTTSAQASGGSTASVGTTQPEAKPFWTKARKIGAFVVGVATIVGAVAAVLALMH